MDDTTKAALAVLLRHGLTLAAGFAVGKGYFTADSATAIGGALATLIPVGLALFSRKKQDDKNEALVIAAQSEQREVLTPAQRDVVRKAIDEGQG